MLVVVISVFVYVVHEGSAECTEGNVTDVALGFILTASTDREMTVLD